MTQYTLEDVPIGSVIRGGRSTYTVTGHNNHRKSRVINQDHFLIHTDQYLCLRDLISDFWEVVSFGKKVEKKAKGFAKWMQKVETQ